MTTKTIVSAVVGLAVIAAVVALKIIFFPSINDKYFTVNTRMFRMAPSGLVIVRPTHFGQNSSPKNRFGYANVKGIERTDGINVTFTVLFATAYEYSLARVTLPLDAPTNGFDFLVTAPGDRDKLLQAAIRKKLGYVASLQTNDVPVLDLKVEHPNSPGLKLSPDSEKENENYRAGRLYFTHTRLNVVTDAVEEMLRVPVVDQTGLTNYYDFALDWNQHLEQQMQSGTLDHETVERIIAGWGLGLEPDDASIETLVVERVK